MVAKFEIATNAAATTWEDLTDLVNWETARFGGSAHRGQIDTGSGFDLLDDAGTRDVPMRRRVRVTETATTPDTVIWQGRTVGDETARGVIRTEDAKRFDIQLVDTNADFGGIGFAGSPRPAETDVQRIQYLLDTYLEGQSRPSTFFDDAYFSSSGAINLVAHKYEGVQPIDWFTHISDATGKQFFLTKDYELFYDAVGSTAFASGLSITDVNPNYTTSFPPGQGTTAIEDGTELFTRVRFRYSGGRVATVVRSALETTHDRWGTAIVDESVLSPNAANTRANNFLDEFGQVQTTYRTFVDLADTQVGLITWGHTVSFRSAAAGVLTPETLRVSRCSWEQLSPERWRAHLELGYPSKFGRRSNPGPPPATGPLPFVPGTNQTEPSDDIVSIYENTTVVNPAQFDVPVSDTFSVIAGHPWRVTINFAAITNSGRVTINCDGAIQPLNAGVPGAGGAGLVQVFNPGALGSDATGCRVYINGDASQTLTTHATDAGKVEYTDGSMLGGPTVPITPVSGQLIVEAMYVSTGTTTTGSPTNYPYAPSSLVITVNGVDVSNAVNEVDPTAGTYSFDTAPPTGAQIVVKYLSTGLTL
jgi:hypothetical protein